MRKTTAILLAIGVTLLSSVTLPAQILTGLDLWLKPEGLTNTVNLSKVSYWTNSVGTGNDATNGNFASQPVILNGGLNGHPVVRFTDNGSSAASNTNLNWLASSLPLSANSNAFTAIVVFETQTKGVRDHLIHQAGGGYAILYVETNGPAGTPAVNSGASGRVWTAGFPQPARSWTILAVSQDPVLGTLSIYQNGNLIGSTNIGTGASTAAGPWVFGARAAKDTHGLNGDIAELMIYTNALNSVDIGNVTYYLAQKYGFVVLTDTFDTSDTANLDQDIALRQSGFLAPQAYDWSLATIANNAVSLSVPGGPFLAQSFCPDTNLFKITAKDFKVSYDINSFNVDSLYGTWAGVVINHSQFKPANPVSPDGLGAIIFTNGARIYFLNGAGVPGGGNPDGGPGGDANLTVHPPYHVEITVSDNVAIFSMTGTNAYGITNLVDVIPLTCPVGNYVSLSVGGNAAATVTYDNLSITASPKAAEIIPALASPPTLLLADAFSTADTIDLNDNLATRQSGTTATVPWMTQHFNAESSIAGNQLILSNTPTATNASVAMAAPTLDFRLQEHLSSFKLRCTMKSSGTANEWAGIRFRENFTGVFVADNTTPGIGFIVRGDASWTLFQGGTVISQGSAAPAADYTLEVEVRENVMRATLNGLELGVGCGEAALILPNTQKYNFITLEAFANAGVVGHYATFDNFEISSLNTGRTVTSPVLVNPVYTAGATNQFTFDLSSLVNVFYGIERKGDLSAPAWTDAGRFYGSGAVMTITNTPGAATPGFYRVRVP